MTVQEQEPVIQKAPPTGVKGNLPDQFMDKHTCDKCHKSFNLLNRLQLDSVNKQSSQASHVDT